MQIRAANPKITPKHLSLLAVVYIRRSSMPQVIEHTASGAYQRSFHDVALSYGWEDNLIKEIDLDDGKSGASTANRAGFQWIRQQIYEGRVGAIFCWEASRLARDNSDFAQLIKLCAAYDTLIIDEKGVYDPDNLNDRIYLGIMGVLGEAEVRRFAERTKATKRLKAAAGELRMRPPTGYVYDDEGGKLILDPNEEVQNAIRLFHSKYDEYESAYQVVKYFNREGIKFPVLVRCRGKKSQISWVPLMCCRALYILHSPVYAGAYVYGRSKIIPEMLGADTSEQKKRRIRFSLDSREVVLIRGTHEGYISWEKFLENQQRLAASKHVGGGGVRNGAALLHRIVECGCGRRMRVQHYSRATPQKGPSYQCNYEQVTFGKKICLHVNARQVDRAVSNALLDALSPAQLSMTLNALEQVDEQAEANDQLHLAVLERARDDLDAARRKFDSIDPDNWLVAKEYEKRMQEKYLEVQRLEERRAKALKVSKQRSPNEVRQALSAVGEDLRTVWEHTALTNAERKKVVRCLISKVTIQKHTDPKCVGVTIHWATGASTPLTIFKNPRRSLDPKTVEYIRSLARTHTLNQIVKRLNEEGIKPKRSDNYNRYSLASFFRSNGIELACPGRPNGNDQPRGDGRYPLPAVAKMLNRHVNTIDRWRKRGILDATRDAPRGAYWIKLDTEDIRKLKKP